MRLLSKMLAAGGVILAVSGCNSLPEASLGKTFTAESFLNRSLASGSDFNSSLAREYQALAVDAAKNDVNWHDATAYVTKGEWAAEGKDVRPWDPSLLGVSGEAQGVYQQLLSALSSNKASNGAACAKAQATYDHWVEELHEDWHSLTDPHMVRGELTQALNACGGGGIYFGFGSSSLNAKARETIAGIVQTIKAAGNPSVSVVGYTDTVGSKGANQRLSERRARAVANALISGGVSKDSITTAGRGELELAVPTADNVREARNRRVEVSISQ